ncbi:MAG: hypothetical protein ACYTGG_06800 [Planctomycetota bacterium]
MGDHARVLGTLDERNRTRPCVIADGDIGVSVVTDLEPVPGVLGIDDRGRDMEAFYNVARTPAARLTIDRQVLDFPLPEVDSSVILGLRPSMRV